MFPPSAGVSASDWEATSPAVRALLAQLSNRVAQLEEQKGRSSRNSSKLPPRDGSGLRPKATRSARAVAAIAEVIPHFPSICRGCGEAPSGEDPEPHRHHAIR